MKRLGTRQYDLLCEALRRYTRFHAGKPLTSAWTGLGTATEYAPAVRAWLMVPYASIPRANTWFLLTEKGAAIVKSWLEAGFTYADIEAESGPIPTPQPPREIA
jgi:hypothetical protein